MDRERGIILLVQEAKRHLEGEDTEQQLFAGAVQVAAFLFHTIDNSASLDSLSSIFYKSHSWHRHDWDCSDVLQGALLLL